MTPDRKRRTLLEALANGMSKIEERDVAVTHIRMGSTVHDTLAQMKTADSLMWGAKVTIDPSVWGTHAVVSCDPQFGVEDVVVRACSLFDEHRPCDGCVIQDVMDL